MMAILALAFLKKPAELSMLFAIFLALLIAVWGQDLNLSLVLTQLFTGPQHVITGSVILDNALSHGGIQSMLGPMSLALLILALGGLLDNYDFLNTLCAPMIRDLKDPFSLVLATLVVAVMANLMMGEAYLSIILTSRLFKHAYYNLGLDSCVLSKAIEEGSTFSTPLIPWTTSGAFIAATLGVFPSEYIFWALFNWIAPIMFLGFVALKFLGLKMYVHVTPRTKIH